MPAYRTAACRQTCHRRLMLCSGRMLAPVCVVVDVVIEYCPVDSKGPPKACSCVCIKAGSWLIWLGSFWELYLPIPLSTSHLCAEHLLVGNLI